MALMDAAKPTKILKRDALGRVTLPRQQREALLDECKRHAQHPMNLLVS
jgi:hypothetical protein